MKLKPGKLYILLDDYLFIPANWKAGKNPTIQIKKDKILFFVETNLDYDPVFLYGTKLLVPLFEDLKNSPQDFLEEII